MIVLEENAVGKNSADTNAKMLMQLAGAVTAFNGVDGVEYQRKVRFEWS